MRRPRQTPALGSSAGRRTLLSFILNAEHQPPANSVRLDKPRRHFVAEPVNTTGSPPRQSMSSLVPAVIIARQCRYGDEPIGSGLLQPNEKPEIGNAADAGRKDVAHPASEECRTV